MKPKIPLKRVDSSNCVVYVGRRIAGGKVVEAGTPYKVHEGEWVDILPVTSVGELIAFGEMAASSSKVTKEKKLLSLGSKMGMAFESVVQRVAQRVYDWNWTDIEGKRLPNPHNNPDVIRSLSTDELVWLANQAEYETEIERKNA